MKPASLLVNQSLEDTLKDYADRNVDFVDSWLKKFEDLEEPIGTFHAEEVSTCGHECGWSIWNNERISQYRMYR